MAEVSKIEAALRLVRERGAVRPRDLAERDIPPDYLDRLFRRGLVDRVGRGVYAWPNSRMKDFYDVVVLARTFPFDGPLLVEAVRATFARRSTAVPVDPPGAGRQVRRGRG